MYVDIHTRRRGLIVTMIPATRVIMMFVIITMLYTAGGGYPDNSQERQGSENIPDDLFHDDVFTIHYLKILP